MTEHYMHIESIANTVSIIVSAFLGIHFLFLKNANRRANVYLGLFLLLTSYSVFGTEIEVLFTETPFIELSISLLPPTLISIILFYYALAMTNSGAVIRKKYRWLFLIAFFEMGLNALMLSPTFQEFETGAMTLEIALYFFSQLASLSIMFLIIRKLHAHNHNILRLFSSLDNKQLIWLRSLILVNIGFLLIWLIDDSLVLVIGDNLLSEGISAFSLFATLVTILWIGFAGLRQTPIFDTKNLNSTEDQEIPLLAYTDSLKAEFEAVRKRIEEEKIYLDQELTLRSLAKRIEIKEKQLSQLINLGFQNNFYHFINHYRIEYFKQLMQQSEYKNLSIEGLSQESGFKSKSTFYTAFKKIEGMTPKEYELRKK